MQSLDTQYLPVGVPFGGVSSAFAVLQYELRGQGDPAPALQVLACASSQAMPQRPRVFPGSQKSSGAPGGE